MRNWNYLPKMHKIQKSYRFQRTYEELKQIYCTIINYNIFRFSAYLWGIETSQHISFLKPPFVFSVPMRNWNIIDEAGIIFNRRVFSVPMRNWNVMKHLACMRKAIVFSVPMRNWNVIFSFFGFVPSGVFSVPMRNWNLLRLLVAGWQQYCFQRTYEELKLQPAEAWWCSDSGFQRTYEELKRRYAVVSCVGCRVFSVPMRNWNTA